MLASRTGKSETEILKEEVKAEKPKVRARRPASTARARARGPVLSLCPAAGTQGLQDGCGLRRGLSRARVRPTRAPPCPAPRSPRPQLRLNAAQLDEKRAAEAAIEEVQELLDAATSEDSKGQLKEELAARQAKLDELMAGFEVRRGRARPAAPLGQCLADALVARLPRTRQRTRRRCATNQTRRERRSSRSRRPSPASLCGPQSAAASRRCWRARAAATAR